MWDASRPDQPLLVRNDDVDHDTDAEWLGRISGLLARYGVATVHAVTVRGISSVPEGGMSRLDNAEIVRRGGDRDIRNNRPLLECLQALAADQVALHGLYHVHHRGLAYRVQQELLGEGLCRLYELLPGRAVRYFVPPFDEYDDSTLAVCEGLGLRVLSHPAALNLDNYLRDRRPLPRGLRRVPFVYFHHKRYYPNEHVRSWNSNLEQLERTVRWIVRRWRRPRWGAGAVGRLFRGLKGLGARIG
ncbi:MAG: hypothetical protein ACUVUC_03105 [Thermoguttaceae bacterium]